MRQLGFIWLAGFRDLRWRRRRFAIAGFATALVFSITLLLAGTAESFRVEISRVLDDIGADGYVVQASQRGPFMSPQPFSTDIVDEISQSPGVTEAEPLISIIQPDMYLFGISEFGGLAAAPGNAIVDRRVNAKAGGNYRVGASEFIVSQITKGQTVLGGQPLVRLSVADAQKAIFGGLPLMTSVAVKGTPTSLPAGFKFVDRAQAARDFMRPIDVVTKTIQLVSVMLWIAAAAIVGSVVYISTLERTRDISVFKAIGASTRSVLVALVVQAVTVSLAAAGVAIALAYALAPAFPMPVSFPARLSGLIPAIGVVVGLGASIAGLRRAVKVDPALAMGSPG